MSLRSLTLLAIAAGTASTMSAEETTTDALVKRLNDLDQRLRISERKAEIAAEAAVEKSKGAVVAKASDEGFSIGSADGLYKLGFGVLIQADGRFYLGEANDTLNNTFLIRRGIPTLDAKLGPYIKARLQTNFTGIGTGSANTAGGTAQTAQLLEGWVDLHPWEEVGVKIGRYKTLGLEYTNNTAALTFAERGFPTNLAPLYDTGAALTGTIAKVLSYSLGIFDGAADGQERAGDVSDAKDGVLVVGLKPFARTDNAWLKGLNIVAAVSLGQEAGNAGAAATTSGLTAQYVSPGQAKIFSYNNTIYADGRRERFTPALEWYADSFGLLAEYAQSTSQVHSTANAARQEGITNRAWQITGSYVLTGEAKSANGVNPSKPFDPATGGIGAWEVALRVGQFLADQDAFDAGYAARGTSVEHATNIGIGVNWWATRNLKWQTSYDLTTFSDGGGATSTGTNRDVERAVVTRFQISY